MVTGSALERGCVGKLLGTRADHVRDGVANRNPEPPQVEEGNHPSSFLRVVRKDPVGVSLLFLLSPDFERQEKAAKGSKRQQKTGKGARKNTREKKPGAHGEDRGRRGEARSRRGRPVRSI